MATRAENTSTYITLFIRSYSRVLAHILTTVLSHMCAPDICAPSPLLIPECFTTGIIKSSEAKSSCLPLKIRQVRDARPENR